ncbi:restriction endonuclease subunit S [Janthinobacterium sp. SUN128]|uniref:restriction endonuclease subunit S n=1 Tax=Janthinobacterium sp. SUN128 TaxID=3014790 RepID=UPI002712E580|nr:restriction endonuclease subunit S [Janthinobacterium sp. SUN128]MDO8036076.1 restriction endonuclease subunit S [Janthinobacterium sp. SUN128]
MSFRQHSHYKESGVKWLGQVPSHWSVRQARRVFEQRRDASLSDDEQLSATQKYGVVPQKLFMELEDKRVMLALAGLEGFKHVEANDFVISLRSFEGGIERSTYAGCVSPAYTVLRALCPIVPRFWEFLFKSASYIGALQTMTDGIRDGKNISYGQFGALELPVPDVFEQLAVASFLDRETAKIDVLISEQGKLIALLVEKRQATISRALTKGLNPDAPMKNSGLEWLGDVPEHWLVARLGHFATVENGTTPRRDLSEYWDGGDIPWLASGEVNQTHIYEAAEFITAQALSDCSLRMLPVGTVVIGMIGQGKTRGMAAILHIAATINQNLAAICPGPKIHGTYLLYIFNVVYEWLREAGRGGNQAAMNCQILSALRIPLPPLNEQIEIAGHIDHKLEKMQSLSREAEKSIALLNERRSALISAAVTGNIDVRQAVQQEQALLQEAA